MKMSFATRPLLTLIAAATLALPGAPLNAQVNLPALGDAVSQDLDVGSERRLGDQVMRQIRVDPDYVLDPLLQEYLEGIWTPLVNAARKLGHIGDETQARFAWEPFLVRDKSVNAFALPGGFVGTHLGLISMTVSRDELASVLAHELSHITQRHIARRIAGDSKNSMVAVAGLLLGILAASRGNIDMANAGIVGGQAAATQLSLNFSRDMEREADRVGFNVLVEAGFSGAGMVSMFERMEQAYHLMDNGAYPYLRSHPLTSERIGDARTRLALEPFSRPRGLAEHALMAARARALQDPRVEAWKVLENYDAGARNIKESGGYEQLGARYAAALSSIKLRNFDRAEATLRSAEVTLQLLNPSPTEMAAASRVLTYLRAELANLMRQDGDIRESHEWQEDFRRAVDAIAGLTAVDGATLITDQYEVLAFGAKITRRRGSPPVETVMVTEPVEGSTTSTATPTQLGGTRHLSAAQFVHDQRDAVALVASQDGRFTIFKWSSCEDLVHAHRVETLLL